jgi:hypothetical protein
MAGTGFFDSWSPVDTNNPLTTPVNEPEQVVETVPEVIVTDEWPKGDLSEEPTPMQAKAPVVDSPVKTIAVTPKSNNPAWDSIQSARRRASKPRQRQYVFLGWAAPPKAGKTGAPLDSLTPEEIENGAEIHHYDFDMGGESTRAAHHYGKKNILTINPWVLNKNPSRVPYDFPKTYQRVMDLLLAAQEQSDIQEAYFEAHGKMPNPYLKTVVFDGADHWLNICETTMKCEDLNLGADGIAVAGKKATVQIGRFNWNIRKNRYNAAMTSLTELCRSGIHCYLITHLKDTYDSNGNELAGAEVPNWLKGTEKWLQQRAVSEIVHERNDMGELTGVVRAYAILTENRTSLKTPGKVLIFERNKDGGVWYGWKGLRDGSFDHPDDKEAHEQISKEE